jgi:putative transposase
LASPAKEGRPLWKSSAIVSRLTSQSTEDHKAFQVRDLSKTDFVYVWADGVHAGAPVREVRAG